MPNLIIPFMIATVIPAAYAFSVIKLDFFKTIFQRLLIISALAGLAADVSAYFINPLFLKVNGSTKKLSGLLRQAWKISYCDLRQKLGSH